MSSSAPRVQVEWFDRELSLAEVVRRRWGPQAILSHHCPRCGIGDHGRPSLVTAHGSVALSASRAGDHLVVAWVPDATSLARIGVDIELSQAPAPPAELVLHPSETDLDPLTAWTTKEAILKLLGVGLARPMTTVRVADFRVWPLDCPAGVVGHLALDLPGGATAT